jgi:hypothetical protein
MREEGHRHLPEASGEISLRVLRDPSCLLAWKGGCYRRLELECLGPS